MVDNKPWLFTLQPEGHVEEVIDFNTTGSGAPIAEYLLGNLYKNDLDVATGALIAGYVIGEVGGIVGDCGGDAVIVRTDENGLRLLDPAEMQSINERIDEVKSINNDLLERAFRMDINKKNLVKLLLK